MLKNGLYIVSTPIGNLSDITTRAVDVLQNADVIACEDTRVSKKLFSLLGLRIDKKFICYEDHREDKVAQKIADMIESGLSVALISDAGSPLISDPGYKLVKLCREKKLYVTVIPGVSAVISALQISGLRTNRFMFAGFIPNKQKARLDLFSELKDINTTLVFYETAPRLIDTLKAMKSVFEKREIAVARELTKIHEECISGPVDELIMHYEQVPPKGEIVVMVEPPLEDKKNVDVLFELNKRLKTMHIKDAVKEVADLSGKKKNEVYQEALRLKNE
ncbi:MAG: 16S rRNA (cytidine(1402)-2'-O)-methyltransferase [Alphaproteobacteria bacterium]|nr:16S rRNA (cytidine(1402)-2'-O)-methyltransferase [Alphaproteobacteria bacterium]